MTHTLLMRLIAPMQSWGVQSDFTHRDTGLEPSKSGVTGLLCAALGKPRDEAHPDNQAKPPLAQLAQLRMGVRVDREGLLKRDYHTAQNIRKASGGIKDTELSERFYLADAAFLVGLEGEDLSLLRRLDDALRHPHWFLFLGRKAFVPSAPVWLKAGVLENESLESALSGHGRLKCKRQPFDDDQMRLVIEVKAGECGDRARRDQPISFVKSSRQFGMRQLQTNFCADRPRLNDKEG